MKRPKDEEPAIESKQKKKAKLPQPIKIPVGTVTPLRSSKELWVKTCLLISKLFNASICGLLVPFVIVFFWDPRTQRSLLNLLWMMSWTFWWTFPTRWPKQDYGLKKKNKQEVQQQALQNRAVLMKLYQGSRQKQDHPCHPGKVLLHLQWLCM